MPDNSRRPYDNQIENRNFLSPQSFIFTLQRAPKVSFLGNSANIPALNLGVANQPNYLRDIPTPGDKIDFEDFSFRFLVDEKLQNYNEISNWIRGLGFPDSLQQIYDLQEEGELDTNTTTSIKQMDIYSDGTLFALNSSNNTAFKVHFEDLYPYALSTLTFDATVDDYDYFTAEVSFKYTIFKIEVPS